MPALPTVTTRQRWLVPVLIVVVALTVSGGLLARELYQAPGGAPEHPAEPPAQGSSPQQQPGSPIVRVAQSAARHPQGDEVRALLQDYFDAINQGNYQLWTTTVIPEWVRNKPEQEWLAAYRSTTDGNILLYRIEALAGQRLRVLVGFTSTQKPDDAPAALPVGCIRWHLALPAVKVRGQWKLDRVPAGLTPVNTRCDR